MPAIEYFRSESLRRVVRGEAPAVLLRDLCVLGEELLPGRTVGVTLLDRSSRLFESGVFPSLDDSFGAALNGIAVVDKPGACALAVYQGLTVECAAVADDPRFSDGWKALCAAHGLRALTSYPARGESEVALGTLVVAYPPGTQTSAEEHALIARLIDLVATILIYRRHQAQQELLVGELQHRVRNLFSTIGAVVYSTMKSHPEPETFRRAFDGRLMALAKAHSLALESSETDLRQLLVETLAPYSLDHHVKIEGPKLQLTQEAAVAFSLAAHELATNAAKYGALSAGGGAVEIGWRFVPGGDGDERFELSWTESGGPKVREPSRRGYGQKTLERSLAAAFDGKVELDYDPAGLRCEVSAPHSLRLGQRPA